MGSSPRQLGLAGVADPAQPCPPSHTTAHHQELPQRRHDILMQHSSYHCHLRDHGSSPPSSAPYAQPPPGPQRSPLGSHPNPLGPLLPTCTAAPPSAAPLLHRPRSGSEWLANYHHATSHLMGSWCRCRSGSRAIHAPRTVKYSTCHGLLCPPSPRPGAPRARPGTVHHVAPTVRPTRAG